MTRGKTKGEGQTEKVAETKSRNGKQKIIIG